MLLNQMHYNQQSILYLLRNLSLSASSAPTWLGPLGPPSRRVKELQIEVYEDTIWHLSETTYAYKSIKM